MPEDPKDLFPSQLTQNPSPVQIPTQDRRDKERSQVDRIMEVFLAILPSNYVSKVTGPYYSVQYQAAAEQIAKFQITAQEVFSDGIYGWTRPEFIHQILGSLVFPDASDGLPDIEGDLSYREFLRRMVVLLLQGATKQTIQGGVELLTDAAVEILERGILRRRYGAASGYGPEDQFVFEINVSNLVGAVSDGTFYPQTGAQDVIEIDDFPVPIDDNSLIPIYGFPDDPFTFIENLRLVMRALKPAHTLYDLRFLFRDSFGEIFTEEMSWEMDSYYYEDLRKYCLGAKNITSEAGETLVDRSLFSDPTRDFSLVHPGAKLMVLTGLNALGRPYRVAEVRTFPVGDDTTARAYTTSPTGLTGTATVSDSDIEDPLQDFGQAVEGEILTFTEGPNAGDYRLSVLLGLYGGPVGGTVPPVPWSYTRVRAAPSLLRIDTRMPTAATGQTYTVTVDRLGVQVPQEVSGEDASIYFYL
jgi:hypothetical protein